MSYSSLLLIGPAKAKDIAEAEFGNAWLAAPVIWDHLCLRYLGREEGAWMRTYGSEQRLVSGWQWDAAKNKSIPLHLRICHVFCFDRVYCAPKNIARLIEACKRTWQELLPKNNHWLAIAEALEKLDLGKSLGVGFNATSVCSSWEGYPKAKAYELFDVLENLEEEPL